MISEEQLVERLEDWGREYRGGRYEHVGWHSKNILQVCHEHKGFKPDARGRVPVAINTPADEVEAAVMKLQLTPPEPLRPNIYYRAAMCLRACYVAPQFWPESERLTELRRNGVPVSRSGYYEGIRLGKAYVAGFLAGEIAA